MLTRQNYLIKVFLSFLIASAIFLFLPEKVSAQVVINEFVPDASPEWVEFYNASESAEFMKSYWLDDDLNFTSDSGSSAKKLLSELNTANSTYPYIEISSFLNNSGDYIVLFDSGGAVIDQHQYSENPGDNVSIGRNPDRSGSFTVLSSLTKGSANAGPQPTPTSAPEPTATPQSENTPTPTLTPKPPTPTPTKKPTPTPTGEPTLTPTPVGEVLSQEATPTPESSPTPAVLGTAADNSSSFLPKILIGVGLLLLLISGGFLFLPKLKGYNRKEKIDDQTPNFS